MDVKNEKIVVLDFDIPQLLNNRIFDPKQALKVSHTILPTCFLYRQALSRGIKFVTPDIFLQLRDKPKNTPMVSALVTPFTVKLIAAGAKPLILTCLESPFIATKFYLNLKKYSGWFKYSMVFSGMKKQLSAKTIYRQMFIATVYDPESYRPLSFAQKKYLTMISGNKRMGNWKKDILLKLFYGFGVREIYSLRREVINFFAQSGRFDLYGVGWDKGGVTVSDTNNIKKVYKGPVEDKLPVLGRYKFTFCFENTIFPGYVTEKIFDAMFGGSVPVYLGAPDIFNFVPEGAFVDMRQFKNLKDLDLFLSSVTEQEYQTYLSNIREFLNSPAYQKKFGYKPYNAEIINILEREFISL